MRKVIRHNIANTNINKKMKQVSSVMADKMITDDYRYRKNMCKDCKFFIEERCTKGRIAKTCAEKGLKNR